MVINKTTGFSPTPLSGGLNTSSPHTNLEPNESPDMMNMQIDFDGSLIKRSGVTVLQTATNTPFVYNLSFAPIIVPIRTPYGKNLLLVRKGDDIVIYAENSTTGIWTAAKTFSNMFRETAAGVSNEIPWDYTILNEGFTTKVILMHPSFVPIQVSFYCGSHNAATYTNTTIAVPNLPIFMDGAVISFSDMFGFTDTGSVVIPTNYTETIVSPSWGTGTWTFAATGHGSGTWRFDYIVCCVQWWAEAIRLTGDQIIQTVVNGVSSRDIPVPTELLHDIDTYTTNRYPIHVYTSSAYDAKLTYTSPPTTSSQWSFSSGEYVSNGVSKNPATPYWITIGANVTSSRTLLLNRGYKLPFYGGQGADFGYSALSSSLVVHATTGSTSWQRYTAVPPSEGGAGSGNANSFTLRTSSYAVSSTTSTSTRGAMYITFDGTDNVSGGMGAVDPAGEYYIVDTLSKTHYDNNRLGQVPNYTNTLGDDGGGLNNVEVWTALKLPFHIGKAYPVFGISDYCNYGTGSFPSVSAVCQSRLAIAGMVQDPLRVVFSNVTDAHSVPGIYCNNYQTVLDPEYDEYSAFDIVLSSRGDDRITAMLEHNDRLFVWTKYKTFMIYSDTGTLNYTTAKYSVVAERGCANCRAVALMDNIPVFISNDGVYAVVPNDNSSGYHIQELSTKVRKIFTESSSLLSKYSWLMYDSSRKELYVGVRELGLLSECMLLYIYKPTFNAWSKYSIDGYSFPAYSGCVIYETSGLARVLLSMTCKATDLTEHRLCQANNNYFVDLLDVDTWSSGTLTPDFSVHGCSWTYNGVTDYLWSQYPTTGLSIGRAIPYREYNDLAVYWETSAGSNSYTQLTEGTHYIKTQHGIRLITTHPSGGSVRVLAHLKIRGKSATRLDFKYPVVCVQNGVVRLPFEFSVAGFAATYYQYQLTFNGSFTPTGGVSLYLGTMYPSWVTTPAITGDTLSTKNIKHYLSYFDNRVAVPTTSKRIDVSVGLMYDDEYQGFLSECVYGYMFDDNKTDLWYDTDMYGEQQYKSYSRVVFPVVGSYQLMNVIHFTYSPCTFKIVGYEVEFIKTKREGYSSTENQTLR